MSSPTVEPSHLTGRPRGPSKLTDRPRAAWGARCARAVHGVIYLPHVFVLTLRAIHWITSRLEKQPQLLPAYDPERSSTSRVQR